LIRERSRLDRILGRGVQRVSDQGPFLWLLSFGPAKESDPAGRAWKLEMRSFSTGSLFSLHKNENEMEAACGGMIAGGFRSCRRDLLLGQGVQK
jgi:hypothetical protein